MELIQVTPPGGQNLNYCKWKFKKKEVEQKSWKKRWKKLKRSWEKVEEKKVKKKLKKSWKQVKNKFKTLPEAQRTQGIESITWIMFLAEIDLK